MARLADTREGAEKEKEQGYNISAPAGSGFRMRKLSGSCIFSKLSNVNFKQILHMVSLMTCCEHTVVRGAGGVPGVCPGVVAPPVRAPSSTSCLPSHTAPDTQ